jgi:hypothetical protein
MRRILLCVVVLAFLLSACLPGLDNEKATQTPIIITATRSPSASTATSTAPPTATATTQSIATTEPSSTPQPTPTSTIAPRPTLPALPTQTATELPPAPGEITLIQAGYGQAQPGDVVGWGIIVENANQQLALADIEYRIILFNDAGVVVETDDNSIPLISPGERTGFAGSTYVEDGVAVARMEVQLEAGLTTSVDVSESFTVDTVSYFADEFFARATGLVSNPLSDMVTDLRVSAITYDAEGNINGGGYTYLSSTAPAAKTGVDVPVDTGGDVASVELFANLSYLSDTITPNPETDPLITQFGFGQELDSTGVGWAALIKNPNTADLIRNSEIQVWFQDADGRVLESDYSSLEALPAGATIGFADDFIFLPDGTTATTMSILIRPGTLEPSDLVDWFSVENATYVADDYFPEVTGIVNNPFPQDYESLYATAILYDEAGNIIGGGYTFLDFALANSATEVTIGVTTSATPARVEIYVLPSGLTEF